jgi:hypothetical protein
LPMAEPIAEQVASDAIPLGPGPWSPRDDLDERRAVVRHEVGSEIGHIHASTPDPAPFPDAVPASSVSPAAEPARRELPETAASAPLPGRASPFEPADNRTFAQSEGEPVRSQRDESPTESEPAEPAHDPAPSPAPPPASPSPTFPLPAVEPRITEPPQLVEARASEARAGPGRIEVRIGRLELRPESRPPMPSPRPTIPDGGPSGLALARRYLDRVWR